MEFTKDIHFSSGLKEKESVEITYSGDLFKKNSEFVAIVYGFGENWEHTTEKEMKKIETGFSAEIEIKENFDTFNFCFRNGNYEWDNNQTFNYISSIEPSIVEEENIEVENIQELENTLDSNVIIEFLDNLLNETLNDKTEATETTDNKQQILDDILSENAASSEKANTVLAEDFDMDKLIENILNPVINCEIIEDEFEPIANFKEEPDVVLSELMQELEEELEKLGSETNTVLAETKEDNAESNSSTALVPTPEDTYLVSPRKLRKFYLMAKKIKLAFYKLFVSIPKLLSGTLNENND